MPLKKTGLSLNLIPQNMSLKIGIVGLPNVGKSTVFNALTRSHGARVSNYPFCTIDPNVGVVEVPDPRINQLVELAKPEKTVPATIEFFDIAGLVKNAHQGEGLGNQFLAQIRECDAILEIIRFFEDSDITHVDQKIEPKEDLETLKTELVLADLQTLEKKIDRARTASKSGDKKIHQTLAVLEKIQATLNEGKRASAVTLTKEEKELILDLPLITFKPYMVAANLSEKQVADHSEAQIRTVLALDDQIPIIPVCAKLEQELVELPEKETEEFLKSVGLEESGLNLLIQGAYRQLDLITYFTVGPKEVHAWPIPQGFTAPEAAGKIHTDFQMGFIKAEVISFKQFIEADGQIGSREKGVIRQEGKNYVVQDGDIMFFLFNKTVS